MNLRFTVLILFLTYTSILFSQVGINTSNPSPASVLDVHSTADNINFGGFMPPKVSLAERDLIPVTVVDEGMMIFYSEGNDRCIQIYNSVDDIWENVYCMPVNDVPIASNLTIQGTLADTETINAQFNYFDDENDPPGNHIYTWYKSASSDGSNPILIQSGTSSNYTILNSEVGFYIGFSVEPIATQGNSPGNIVLSNFDGPISNAFTPALDLFISEYIEGSSNNKIIEVANFTGSSINLSNYQMSGFQNGSSSSNYTYSFPNVNLLNGEVYVIAHSSYSGASDAIYNWSFNGNDVVILEDLSSTTIDIIGVVGNSSDFAKDVTLRKKPGIGPSTSYNANDYDSFPQNTFTGLGNHNF